MSIYRLDYPLDDTDPIVMPKVNPEKSCIYIFFIEDKGCYVGKSDGRNPKSRWQKRYSKNVQDMIEGKSWHGDPKKDFRPVHYALFQAVKKKLKVALIISENLTGFALLDREKDLINSIGTLNGRRVKKAKKAVGKKIIETVKAVGV